jgi:hypothetical protein
MKAELYVGLYVGERATSHSSYLFALYNSGLPVVEESEGVDHIDTKLKRLSFSLIYWSGSIL